MRAIKLSGGNVVHCTPFHPPISCPCSTNHLKPPFLSVLNPFSSSFYPLFLTITSAHALPFRAVSNWVVVIFHLTHITAATTSSTASSTSTRSPNTIPPLFLFYLFQFLISSFGGSSKHESTVHAQEKDGKPGFYSSNYQIAADANVFIICRSRDETCPSISGNLCKCAYHHIALLL